ncbi:glycosyl transferase family 90-domain-containing protein, partial [Mycena epipterygia]
AVDELYARQSTSLAQASARYSLRTQRPPPPNYDLWYQFARDRKCLIDEYDQIHRDFKPFYQLAQQDPRYFQTMIDQTARSSCLVIRRTGATGRVHWGGYFSAYLPNMTFLLNGRDEPRVAFNYRASDAMQHALSPNDTGAFDIHPRPTSEFFQHQSGCIIPKDTAGFMESANNDSGFLIASAKPGFTTDLYPMVSMSKISPCFSDILFPTEYYYDRSWWSGKFAHPDNIPWEDKTPKIYWRGMSNGGMIIGENYHHFARFKLADMAREHPDLMDVAITRFAETLCEEGCDRAAVLAEYNITGNSQPREDLYRYKYVIDVDGTTFSGRFLGLLRSGSLVFKSTLFEEYFNDWLRPFEHYVPVKADLSDLVQQITWANEHPDEARLIQQRGMEMARRVLTDDQNDCYFSAVLLEWAQL